MNDPNDQLRAAFGDRVQTIDAEPERPTLTPREAAQEQAGQNDPLARIATALERIAAQLETGVLGFDNNTQQQKVLSFGNVVGAILQVEQQRLALAGQRVQVPSVIQGAGPRPRGR